MKLMKLYNLCTKMCFMYTIQEKQDHRYMGQRAPCHME